MHAFAICTENGDYPASLEKRKLYEIIPDPEAEKHNQIRVIDESGDDYLFPLDMFLKITLPAEVADQVARIA
jgi:hypothetical protein